MEKKYPKFKQGKEMNKKGSVVFLVIEIILFLLLLTIILVDFKEDKEECTIIYNELPAETIKVQEGLNEVTIHRNGTWVFKLVEEEKIEYVDLYINIDDIGEENPRIYTKDEWLE